MVTLSLARRPRLHAAEAEPRRGPSTRPGSKHICLHQAPPRLRTADKTLQGCSVPQDWCDSPFLGEQDGQGAGRQAGHPRGPPGPLRRGSTDGHGASRGRPLEGPLRVGLLAPSAASAPPRGPRVQGAAKRYTETCRPQTDADGEAGVRRESSGRGAGGLQPTSLPCAHAVPAPLWPRRPPGVELGRLSTHRRPAHAGDGRVNALTLRLMARGLMHVEGTGGHEAEAQQGHREPGPCGHSLSSRGRPAGGACRGGRVVLRLLPHRCPRGRRGTTGKQRSVAAGGSGLPTRPKARPRLASCP